MLGTHLCANWGGVFREDTRMAELEYILKNIDFCDTCELNIWAADFNFKPLSKPYNRVLELGFLDTDQPLNVNATVPVPEGKHKIDHIFYQGTDFEVKSFEVLKMPFFEDHQKYLSDHHAIKAIFTERTF